MTLTTRLLTRVQPGAGAAPGRDARVAACIRKLALSAAHALLLAVVCTEPAHAEPPLWGWADLHAHPASHLAFGADSTGRNGIFWGLPGLELETSSSTVLSDLPGCAPDKHGGFDGDPVRHSTHQLIIGMIETVPGFAHGPSGAPGFSNWPHALSRTHQQMHVTALRRAYDGGQRLMIASVTDSELLSSLWTRIGYNAAGNPVPLPSPSHDFDSAKRQLAFIKQLADANRSWMAVAYSAAQARRIIASNKLALILSVELDALSAEQTLRLVREDGVRHVIPVHLVDNRVGGAAVYDDLFNTANAFLNSTRDTAHWNNLGSDGFFTVEYDPLLRNRLGRPHTLYAVGADLFRGGAVLPKSLDEASFAALGYELAPERGGHKNARGLQPEGRALLSELMQLGVLIDIAHMGQKTADATLKLAVDRGYPVMNSHTGLRAADETASNERSLLRAHARTIARLGGVIGLGTEGASGGADPVGTWLNEYRDLLSVLGGRGAALGTDINGLAPQLAVGTAPVAYPIRVAQRFGRASASALPRATLGSRNFDFATDGIAHYGMLADFMQAVSQQPDASTAVSALFHSANDVVEMWERCEARAGYTGDFDGDGRADIAVWRPASFDWAIQLSTGRGFVQRIWRGAWASDGPVQVGDFNGDGKTDLMMWRAANKDWTVNLSTGSGFRFEVWTGLWGSDGPIQVGDFNGDGKTDVIMWREAYKDWGVNLSTGSGFTWQAWTGLWGSDGPIQVGDFNGDGKTDVTMWREAYKDWGVNLSTGSGFTWRAWTGLWGSDGPNQLGDFNGDGKTDVIMWREAYKDWGVNLSTGGGFTWQAWTGLWGSDGPIQVGDFNGDGKTDVIMWREAYEDWGVNLSTGSGFTWASWTGAWGSDGPVHSGDFDGDGRTDVVMHRESAGDWTVNLSRRSGFEFMIW